MDKLTIYKQLLFIFGLMALLAVPNRYPKSVRVIGIIIYFIVVLFLYGTTGFSQTKIDATELAKQYPAKTTLSKKALHLKTGMTKKQIIELLGRPTWAKKEAGISLVWLWDNGRCNPVYVTFNKRMRVNGFDEGREECLEEKYDAIPKDQFLCSKENNKAFCHP